jgi:hypothetical protein
MPKRATANRYGITLDRTWTQWAAKQGLSETVAAALYLISENRKTDEVVVKLRSSEVARVIDIVQCWPDCFPPGALAAIRRSRPAPLPEQSTACTSAGARHRSSARFNSSIGQLHSNGPARPRAAVHNAFDGFAPPSEILRAFCSNLPFCKVEEDYVTASAPLAIVETLGEIERSFYDILRENEWE